MEEFFMKSRLARLSFVALTILVVASFCLVEVSAQSRRKRRARRVAKPRVVKPVITNPPINPPEGELGSDVKIVSTADDTMTGSVQSDDASQKPKTDGQDIQQTINSLSNQVEKLTDKLGEMQENDRTLLDMERLTRAEQRAEGLRSQLLDNESKLANLQSRLEEVEFASKPENIERANATYGSTRPEEAREARRRQLEKEKVLLQNQIRILETGRVRLESAIANADAEVDLLRRRLETRQQERERTASEPATNRKKPE
jgi:chromosome segregation ATPase